MLEVIIKIFYYLEDKEFKDKDPQGGDYCRYEATIKYSSNTFENEIQLSYGDWYHDKSEDKIEGAIKALELMFDEKAEITKEHHWTVEL